MMKQKRISRPIFCLVCAAVFLTLAINDAFAQRIMYEKPKIMTKGSAALTVILEPYLEKYDLPALGAAVVRQGRIVAMGTVGTKRAGQQILVTTSEPFHIGSDTKAMTALIAAMFVEGGKLRWDSTVEEIFPELKKTITPGMGSITLEQLLSHSSGMPADSEPLFGRLIAESFTRETDNLSDTRYWMLARWVSQPLAAAPRRRFSYSNMGYIMAGAMLERVSGSSWEELVVEKVFVPLRLRSAGFGTQSTPGRTDAPLPHLIVDGKIKPMLSGVFSDNPLVMGPAGTVHMSVQDFARWAAWNAGAGKRGPQIVRPETLARLRTPVIDIPAVKDAPPGTPSHGRYALGWGEARFGWAKDPFIYHAGSNGMNLAHIFLQPKDDFAMVLMTNIGGQKAGDAFAALAEELYKRFGKE
ncbi:MAG: serine hydrolase [Syntrophorhabdaceae bacterium]|nr:serine hydrolase [Syntrophorhabdaceae bacterium]